MADVNQTVKAVFTTKGLEQFETSFRQASKSVDSFSKVAETAKKIGSNLTRYISAPLAGVAAASVKTGLEFEQQMSRVHAISGATAEEFEKLKKQAVDLGASTVFSAKEVADAQEELASAGFEVNEILAAMPGLMDLAAVSGGDMALAAEAVGSAINQFGLEMEDATHLADVYAKTAADTNAETRDMAEAMKYTGPIASQLGLSIEETATAIGLMSDAGIKGSQAGTTLRGALTRLAKPTMQSSKLMQELGIEIFDTNGELKPLAEVLSILKDRFSTLTGEQQANVAATIFGQQSMSGMLKLIDGAGDKFDNLQSGLENSTGAAQEMADVINSGLSGSIEEMRGSFETMAINIKEAVEPAFETVVNWITNLIDKFNSLTPEQQEQVVKWTAIAASIGPVISIGSKLASGIGKLKNNLSGFGNILSKLSSPGGLIAVTVTAIAGLSKAVAEGLNESNGHMRQMKDITKDLDSNLASVKGQAGVIDGLVTELAELNSVENKTVDQQLRIQEIIAQLNNLLPEHQLEWDEASNSVKGLTEEYVNYAETVKKQAVWEAQSEAIKGFTDEIVEAQGELYDAGKHFTDSVIKMFDVSAVEATEALQKIKEGANWDDLLNMPQFQDLNLIQRQMLKGYVFEFQSEYDRLGKISENANNGIRESTEKTNSVLKQISEEQKANLDGVAAKSEESIERQKLAETEKTNNTVANTQREQEVKQQASEADAIRNQQDIENIEARNQAIEEATSQLESSYKSHLDALNAVQSEGFESSKVTLDEYLASMRERQEQQHAFDQNMQKLRVALVESGNADLLSNLEQFNVSHAGLVQELVDSDDAKFNELVEIWRENSKTAGESATSELSNALEEFGPIMDEVLAQLEMENPEFAAKAKVWMDNIRNEINNNSAEPANAIRNSNAKTKAELSKISDTASQEGRKVNTETASGINQEHAATQATTLMNENVQRIYRAIADQAFKSGLSVPRQVGVGIQSNTSLATSQADRMVKRVQNTVAKVSNNAYTNGRNVVNGVVNGINSGSSRAYSAGANLANQVNRGFRRNLNIHSPSKVMIDNMKYVIDAIVIGARRGESKVASAGSRLASVLNTGVFGSLGTLPSIDDLNKLNVSVGDLKPTVGNEVIQSVKLEQSKEPAIIRLVMGEHEYSTAVEDITREQDKKLRLSRAF